jgi:hypothetical protein
MIVITQNLTILARSKRLESISKQIAATKSTDELSRKLEVIAAWYTTNLFSKNIFNDRNKLFAADALAFCNYIVAQLIVKAVNILVFFMR